MSFTVAANDGVQAINFNLLLGDNTSIANLGQWLTGNVVVNLKNGTTTVGTSSYTVDTPIVAGTQNIPVSFNNLALNSGTYTLEFVYSGLSSNGLGVGDAFPLTQSIQGGVVNLSKVDLDVYQAVNNAELTETGNIFTDGTPDTLGNKFTTLTIGGQTLTQSSGDVVITGTYGNLTISGDGEYSYQANTATYGGAEEFTYTLTSLSGDTSTATLTIGVGREFTSTAFNDVISTNSNGGDTVIYDLLEATDDAGGNGIDVWTDFSQAQGDQIDVSALLAGQVVTAENLNDFVSITYDEENSTVTLAIDRDGSSGEFSQTELLKLTNQSSVITFEDLLQNNNILF
nr:type I secretion C-terminal target domain-containing protein [Acinetobacter sp. YH18001]